MRVRRIHGWLGVALACALVAPAGAVASQARTVPADVCGGDECNGYPSTGAILSYEAAPWEPNALELSFAGDVVALRDAGAVISAGGGCTSASPHEAACRIDDSPTAGKPPKVSVKLGDLDDTLALVGAFPFAMTIQAGDGGDVVGGGPKDDYVDGGAGDDRLAGDDGADTLVAGEGRDSLAGGDGDDTLVGGETVEAADSFDGGAGKDGVTFFNARHAVTVTLGAQGSGEADAFAGVENVYGGDGDDVITGDDGPNSLIGFEGADRVRGGAGADYVVGGSGRDELSGGDGDDTIAGSTGGRGGDVVSCGAGRDIISEIQDADVLDPDCERVGLNLGIGPTTMRAYPVAGRGGRARFTIPCRARRGCRGSVRLRRAAARRGGTLRTFQTRRRGTITVAVPLPRGALVRISLALERRGHRVQGRDGYTVRNLRRTGS